MLRLWQLPIMFEYVSCYVCLDQRGIAEQLSLAALSLLIQTFQEDISTINPSGLYFTLIVVRGIILLDPCYQ